MNKFYGNLIQPNARILALFPHPDDESAFSGGFISRAVKGGAFVKAISLTKGEASTLRFGLSESTDLSIVREKEFKHAVQTLGVSENGVLDFKDGDLESLEIQIKEFLKDELNKFKPDFILTYEPSGVYGHPDHVALTKYIDDLFAELQNFDLIYVTVSPGFKFSENSLNMAKDRTRVNPLNPNLTIKLTLSEFFTKLKALNCYKSQFDPKTRSILSLLKVLSLKTEYFFVKYRN